MAFVRRRSRRAGRQMLILIDDGKVAPGVKIAGVEVGQTPEEAQVAIAPTTQEMLNATTDVHSVS